MTESQRPDSGAPAPRGQIAWRSMLFWMALPALLVIASGIMIWRGRSDQPFTVTTLLKSGPIHGVEGLEMGPDGQIYAASLNGQQILRIDPKTGAVTVVVPSPYGEADDIAVGPAGTPAAGILAWTAQPSGEVRMQRPGGKPEVVLKDVPRINPITFSADGRLFASQSGVADNPLWEIDVTGAKPPRIIMQGQGALNGFDFGPDGLLYAPLFGTDHIVAIDVDKATTKDIGGGVGSPAAVATNAKGDIYSVDYKISDVWVTDPKTGASRKLASVPAPLDNLTVDKDGTVYVAAAADGTVIAIDPNTGAMRNIVSGTFDAPLNMVMTVQGGKDALLVADPFGYRFVDPATGAVTRPPWAMNRNASIAVAATDRFIAMTTSGGRVKKIDRQTDALLQDSDAIKGARGVALTVTGDIIVADSTGNRIVKLTADGVVPIAENLRQPVAVIMDGDDAVLVAEADGGSVSRVVLATGERREIATGLKRPTGLARLSETAVAVVEPDIGTVSAIALKTGARAVLAANLSLGLGGLRMPVTTPAGISAGRNGVLYVSAPSENTILKLSPAP